MGMQSCVRGIYAAGLIALGTLYQPQAVGGAETNIDLYCSYAEEICESYYICPEVVQALMYYESSYNPNATSKSGAVGLCQIVPKWQQERMKKLGVTDLYDPYSNILVCCDILAEYAEEYEVYLALTAYNCGEYSKTFKRVCEGGTWEYADKVLELSGKLEKKHGK